MAEIIKFPGGEATEEEIRKLQQQMVDKIQQTFRASGWGAERSQRTAEILWAECWGYMLGILSTGAPLREAMNRMSVHSGKRVRELIGLPPSPQI